MDVNKAWPRLVHGGISVMLAHSVKYEKLGKNNILKNNQFRNIFFCFFPSISEQY